MGIPAGGNVGIGFAIPTAVTQSIMKQLIEFGKVRRGGIGARFQDLSPELAEAFALNSRQATYQGAIISSILAGSSAEKAGLKPGDIVVFAGKRGCPGLRCLLRRAISRPTGCTGKSGQRSCRISLVHPRQRPVQRRTDQF